MSDLLRSFDAFFAGEKPYSSGASIGQQVGNESYRVTYTGSQRGELRDRIEQLESQIANARNEALEEAVNVCKSRMSLARKWAETDSRYGTVLVEIDVCSFMISELMDKPWPTQN